MKFYLYNNKKEANIGYSSNFSFSSRIFNALRFQESPKRFWKERLLGGLFFAFNKFNTIEIEVPLVDKSSDTVLRLRKGNFIIFELDRDQIIRCVHRFKDGKWTKESFLGYPLIEEYSIKELNAKFDLVISTLKDCMQICLEKHTCFHGDLTQFNVLLSDDNQIIYIDKKNSKNNKSIYYDSVYFIVYLSQSIFRTSELSKHEKESYILQLSESFKSLCLKNFDKAFNHEELEKEVFDSNGINSQTLREVLNYLS